MEKVMVECRVCELEMVEYEGCGECEECVEGIICREWEGLCDVCKWFVELVGYEVYYSRGEEYGEEDWDLMWEWLNEVVESVRRGGGE
jgi:hypothetical protein